MKERPILFSGEMVRAILDGRKTQTRRVVKPQPIGYDRLRSEDGGFYGESRGVADWYKCPYGMVGDRLWVRETFYTDNFVVFKYRAEAEDPFLSDTKWKPSIFMPRHLSRLTLEIVAVRVERLQDISGEDAIAEGMERDAECGERKGGWKDPTTKGFHTHSPLTSFHILWDKINAKRGYGWDKNPWVWVVEFKQVTA